MILKLPSASVNPENHFKKFSSCKFDLANKYFDLGIEILVGLDIQYVFKTVVQLSSV